MYRIVIPARYASSRLPGKPLLPLAGKPMLEWVYERARRCRAQEVIVATDDQRIRDTALGFGAEVEMTALEHASGTDRIAEVARRRGWAEGDIVVNLQGDEPSMPAELIEQVAALLAAHAEADIATLATPVLQREEYFDPNAVKVVTDLAVLDITPDGFVLLERAPGVSVEQIKTATAGRLIIPAEVPEMRL